MTHPAPSKSTSRTYLIGILMALTTILLVAISTGAIVIGRDSKGSPPNDESWNTTTITPQPEPPVVTVTETETATETATETETATPTPPPAPTTTPKPRTKPTHTDPPPAPNTQPVPNQPQSGPITDADIHAEVASARNAVEQYWTELFASWPNKHTGEPSVWWTPPLYNGDGFYDSAYSAPFCAGESIAGSGASFCPNYPFDGSGWLAWDISVLREFAGTSNDVAAYMVVAHETAHAAQLRFIWDGEGPATTDATAVLQETQADCISGATLGTAVKNGDLTLESGDEADMLDMSSKIGDNEGDHGTDEQRYAAFRRGFDSADIEQCLGNRTP